uniref:Protein MAK10 homolog n=1 Tax=Heterorhabditis bacteriophora TaxID=37862 RepID=A0A1I7XM40_HETBA
MWNADSERLRFEHRMSGLSSIGPPLHMSYADYLIHSKVEELYHSEENVLLKNAIKSFDAARLQFEKLEDRPEMSDMIKPLVRVCRSNIVAARMLASGKVVDRRFEWQFPTDSPMFPVLKMSTHPSEPTKL